MAVYNVIPVRTPGVLCVLLMALRQMAEEWQRVQPVGRSDQGRNRRNPNRRRRPIRDRARSASPRGAFRTLEAAAIAVRLQPGSLGAVSALIGLITAWSVIAGKSNGILVDGVDRSLAWLCGRAPYVIPVLTMLLSYQCFRNRQGRVIQIRQVVAGLAFGMSVTGLTHAAATGTRSDRGGLIGEATYDYSRALVGDYAAAIGLFLIGSAAVLIATNSNPLLLYRELERIGRAIYKPLPPMRTRMSSIRSRPVAEIAAEIDQYRSGECFRPHTGDQHPKKRINRQEGTGRGHEGREPAKAKLTEILSLPDIAQWHLYDQVTLDKGDLTAKARRIEETLASFKVEARVREINPGPAVTQFTLEPGVGTKVRRITELQNDLALALAAPSIRIEAPVPGHGSRRDRDPEREGRDRRVARDAGVGAFHARQVQAADPARARRQWQATSSTT